MALGGSGGGITDYMDQGHLVYLYSMTIIEQYEAHTTEPLAASKHSVTITTAIGQACHSHVIFDASLRFVVQIQSVK